MQDAERVKFQDSLLMSQNVALGSKQFFSEKHQTGSFKGNVLLAK